MTPTDLWGLYYHAMKKWLPKATDKQVRTAVDELMKLSVDFCIIFAGRSPHAKP